MNLARGRELGISSRVDEGHDWIHKPSRSFYEGKASVGEATGGSSGDIAVVLGATNGEDEDNDSRDERAETHVAASSSPAPDVASVVSSSAARLHAFNAPLGRRARVDVANWMAQLVTHIADTPLHKLRLPGTHDSGAYHLSRTRMGDLPAWLRAVNNATRGIVTRPITPIIAGWGEAQSLDVYNQLKRGARYLDLRVVHERGGYFTEHGMAGASYEDVLTQVASFLTDHPGEIVLCDFNHFHRFDAFEDHVKFVDVIERTLGAHMVPRALRRASTEGDGTVTVRDCLAANRRCVCLYGGFDFAGVARCAVEIGCWGRKRDDIWSPWPMAGTRRALVERMRALDAEGVNCRGFFVLQGVVTPDAKRITKAVLLPDWGRPRTLRALAERVTPLVCSMVTGGQVRARCVVMVDHIDVADVEGWLLGAYGGD